jgi:hypothetical protein
MITLKDFMETVGYRITEGSDYCWNCYGSDAYCLDSWNGDQDGHSLTIIFDTRTQEVYEVQAHDYLNRRAYRYFNPDYKPNHDNEATDRGIDKTEAWDDLKYTDLEVEEDFLEKARAIVGGEDYDTRVKVPLTLDDGELFELMKMAHDRDITLNQMVEQVLQTVIDSHREEQALRDELDSIRPEYDFSEGERGPVEESIEKIKKKKKGKK